MLFGHDSANPNGCAFEDSHWLDVSPRLGLAWDPKGDGKQTTRAGFSLLHGNPELFYPERWTTNPPYASSIAPGTNAGPFSNPYLGYVSPTGVPGDPFPGAAIFPAQGAYVSIPSHVPVEYILQWNLSYQRQLRKDWLATATYIGKSHGQHYGFQRYQPLAAQPDSNLLGSHWFQRSRLIQLNTKLYF